MVSFEVYIRPIQFEAPDQWILQDKLLLIVNLKGDGWAIELFDSQPCEFEVKFLIKDRIVGFLFYLSSNKHVRWSSGFGPWFKFQQTHHMPFCQF